MAQYNKIIPKSQIGDQTITATLDAVILYTKFGDKLADYQILPDKVILTFDDGEN